VTSDPVFGPLVLCGLGGVHVELLKDVSFRLTPVTEVDADEMLSRLRSSRLLDGYRGSPPGDRQALLAAILRISALVDLVPELRELDLNPVKVLPPGQGVVAVDGRIRIGPARAESAVRESAPRIGRSGLPALHGSAGGSSSRATRS
jgi:acyl-CoA synthetase (NDP forming)